MAIEHPGLCISMAAGSDLSAKQFLAVKVSAAMTVDSAAAGDPSLGILQDTPKSGEFGNVMLYGVSKWVAGGNVSAGDLVASDAAGKCKTAVKGRTDSTVSSATDPLLGSNVRGIALEAGVANQVIAVALFMAGAVPTTVS